MLTGSKAGAVCLENAVREHLTNATEFLGALRAAPFLFRTGDHVDGLSCRSEANLDALSIAGEDAIAIGITSMEGDGESASVVALLMAESESAQPRPAERAAALLHNKSPEIRRASRWGLRLASSRHIEPHLRALLGKPKWDFASAAALDILAFHRLPVQAEIGVLPDEECDDVAWLLAEAGGRMRGVWNATHLKQFLGHASPRVREAALRASARCGLLELSAVCREATINSAPLEAIEFLGVVGSPEDLSSLKRAASNPAAANAALKGIGRIGLPASVPYLLDLMASAELAEPAAFALWRITGQQVPRGPTPAPPADLSEDELDLWEPKPPVDVPRAHAWWIANESRFDPAKRYQCGLNISNDPLGLVFDQLPLSIRYDVYLRERALTPGTPDWELETWTWNQKNPGQRNVRKESTESSLWK